MSSQLVVGRRFSLLFILCILTAVLGLGLGGGTHSGFLGDTILQLTSIPLLLLALYRGLSRPDGPVPWTEMALCLCIVLVPILQIIPLPPRIWLLLPSREPILEAFRLAGQAPGLRSISVAPQSTALSALSLMPPLALFLAARQLGAKHRGYLVAAVLTVSGFSVFLGLAQIASGEQSPLRFFQFTNNLEAVGFFANRNHFAALLYISVVLASAWAIDAALGIAHAKARDRLGAPNILTLMASATLMFILVAAQIMTRSRAGIILTILAIIGVAVLVFCDPRNNARKTSLKILGLASVAVLLFTAQFGIYRLAERLVADPLNDTRLVFARNTLSAAKTYFPFGSGMGTFPEVYAIFEKPTDILFNSFANHAHDDFLEIWLESGALGMLVLASLAFWIARRFFQVWANPDRRNLPIDHLLARAASISIGLLTLHSLVDYPLRTTALMDIFAICCALLTTTYQELEIFVPAVRKQLRAPDQIQGFHRAWPDSNRSLF